MATASRTLRTPADPNVPTSRIVTLPLPRMRGLEGQADRIEAPIVVRDDWAPDDILAETLEALVQRESDFVAAQTTGADQAGLRHARTLDDGAIEDRWRAWLRPEIQSAMAQWRMNEPIGAIEVQLTAHGDGDFYRLHRDVSDSSETDGRFLTFVYYLSRRPRPFTGGQLQVYDYQCTDGIWSQAETSRLIEPEPNRLVLFPACFVHEVLPVHRGSGAFADSRFTVNGWVHRQL